MSQTEKGLHDEDSYASWYHTNTGIPDGWTMYVNPLGSVYYVNAQLKAVMDEDIHDPELLSRFTASLHSDISSRLPEDTEVSLRGSMNNAPFHLFVNHKQCMAGHHIETIINRPLQGLTMRLLLNRRRMYWHFVHEHPSHRPTPFHALGEAIDGLNSFYMDHVLFGPRSLVPLSKNECEEFMKIAESPRVQAREDSPVTTMFIAIIIQNICSHQVANRYGQLTHSEHMKYRGSRRVSQDISPSPQSISLSRMLLRFIINVPFFGIPQTYLSHIKEASEFRGHHSGVQQKWEAYKAQLAREYSDFILISTVLLSATIGLLAVPGIEQATRTTAIISIFASLGSISIGVFIIWRHQRSLGTTPMNTTYIYIANARKSTLGLPGHALLLSLPPVFLVWSVFMFTVAIVAYTLQDIMAGVDAASSWTVFGIFIVVLVGVLASLYTFSIIWRWQTQGGWLRTRLSRFRALFRSRDELPV